jgi:D-sedoheptulose 7-phosphate isomerase
MDMAHSTVEEFVVLYLEEVSGHLRAISPASIARSGELLLRAYQEGAQVLVAGNGGSASTASHLACDLGKTVLGAEPTARTARFRVVSLADNVALLTAWANDVSYGAVFAEQVKSLGRRGDVLVVITASGNSESVIKAVEAARGREIATIGLLGFDGGSVKEMLDEHIIVACHDYGHVESAHVVVCHLLTEWFKRQLGNHIDAETEPDT